MAVTQSLNGSQPQFKISLYLKEGTPILVDGVYKASKHTRSDWMDIEQYVNYPVTYSEEQSLLNTLEFTIDKATYILTTRMRIGQAVVMWGYYYSPLGHRAGGSDTSDYVMTIKNKVKNNSNIIMTGFVQGNTLEELFSNCFLYCLPSDVEGMPLSLLEAMSYGNKCLVSDIEENTSVVENYGYTFKKSDVRDLTEKLDSLLNDKEENNNESSEKLKRKSNTELNIQLDTKLNTEINNTVLDKEMNKELKRENIQKFILDKYNWDEITKKTEEIYEKIK